MRHVQPGDPVSAGVASSAARTLEARTNFLKELVDANEAGRALVHRDVAVSADVLEWQPVYWDADNQQYEQALAAVESDAASGSLAAAASADVLGLCLAKKAGGRGDILLYGLVPAEQLDNAIDGELTAGRYYLSAVEPGKLVRQRPAVTVAVCHVYGPLDSCDETAWVLVNPQTRDFLEDHVHFQFRLAARPAGEIAIAAVEGERHVIDVADDAAQGWLPADDASFAGHAPAGAAFGYNLAAHPELSLAWPPIPLAAAVLEMFRPEDGQPVGGRLPRERVVMDAYGIWWMSDCYGEAPWPTDYVTPASSSSSAAGSESSSSSEAGECPQPTAMDLVLSFVKMTFATDRSVVTSLTADTGQPLSFVDRDGNAAATGDLLARANLELLIEEDSEAYGGQVLKTVEDNKLQQGYAVEGLIAGSSNVTLSSTRSRYRTPGDADTPLVHQELVTVDVNLDPVDRELLPQIVVLGDAAERVYLGIPYLAFPEGRDSELRLKFVIPADGLPENPVVKLRLSLFGRAAGTLTALSASYYLLARPATGAPTPLAEGDTTLELDTEIEVEADEAHEVESEAIEVAAGDTLYVSLVREADGEPEYDAEIGLLRISTVLTGG